MPAVTRWGGMHAEASQRRSSMRASGGTLCAPSIFPMTNCWSAGESWNDCGAAVRGECTRPLVV